MPPSDSPIHVDSVILFHSAPSHFHCVLSFLVHLTFSSLFHVLAFLNFLNFLVWPHVSLLFFFLLLSLLPVSAATSPTHRLSFFSINVNGLHNIMKTDAIKRHISASVPHVWVINETKSPSPVASHVCVSGYNIYESPCHRQYSEPLDCSN